MPFFCRKSLIEEFRYAVGKDLVRSCGLKSSFKRRLMQGITALPFMKRFFVRAGWTLGLWVALAANGAQFKFGAYTLTVPEGFEVELVAGSPLVERPISGSFDEQGRLYVTDSSGSSEKGEQQLADKSHRVVRLEDSDGDGRF